MGILQIPPVAPNRPGAFADSQWRAIFFGALAAMAVTGTLVAVVAAVGTTVAQVAAVVATANTESAARHAQAYVPTGCGLASR